MLASQLTCVKKKTQKEHILKDVLECNEKTGALAVKRDEIKRILRAIRKLVIL